MTFGSAFILSTLPALFANFIFLLKETPVVSAVAVPEILYTPKSYIVLYYKTYEMLAVLTLICVLRVYLGLFRAIPVLVWLYLLFFGLPIFFGLSVQSDKVDLIVANMTVTPERKEAVDFTNPNPKVAVQALVPNNSAVKSLDDLATRTTIVTTDSQHPHLKVFTNQNV